MEQFKSFLGTGWSFPPEFNKKAKEVSLTSEVADIKSSLGILLSTRLGERVMRPTYGCNLDDLVFEPLNLTVKTYITELIRTAILYHEPRIDLERVAIDPTNELEGELLILIDFKVRATNSRANMVFPFYKGEGTDVSIT